MNAERILSADSHIVEPADFWTRYIDADYAERAPRARTDENGDVEFIVDGDIVLGSVGDTPVHATEAEDSLRDQPLTEENIWACAAMVNTLVDPLDDFRGSAGYKRDMAQVFTRRAIQQAMSAMSPG